MDVVIATLLRSKVSNEVKQRVLQNCALFTQQSEYSDEICKLGTTILSFLSSGGSVPECIRNELLLIVECISSKIPNEAISDIFQSLVTVPDDCIPPDKALLVGIISDSDRFDSYVDYTVNNYERISSIFIILLKSFCILCRLDSGVFLKAITKRAKHIAELLRGCFTVTKEMEWDQVCNVIQTILKFMTHAIISPIEKNYEYLSGLIDLSFANAELLICLASTNISASGSNSKVSISEPMSIANYIYHQVEVLMADAFTPDTAYLPLASLLFRLDSAADVTPVASFVESLANLYAGSLESCFTVLKRLTCWLVWPFRNDSSPLDKWIIGFMCEVHKRTISHSDACGNWPSKEWVGFMNDQLKLTIQLLIQQQTPNMSVLNVLAFLLLAGSRPSRAHRFQMFNKELTKTLLFLRKSNLEAYSPAFLLRISRILQLAVSSMGTFNETRGRCTLMEIPNPAIQFFSQFEDSITYEKLTERSKVYEWPTLLRWGSHAGDNLRRCWSRWEQTSVEVTPPTAFSSEYDHTHGRRLTNHGGLLNIGNTCYANAALQLLYHCLDFRLAVLENPRIKLKSNSSPITTNSAISRRADVSHSIGPNAIGETRGDLYLQLFSLFRSLNTHMGPTVRDPGKVLTLSKPAHFISGEQQDAVEYLIHLLQQLHDEEIELERRDCMNTPHVGGFNDETNVTMVSSETSLPDSFPSSEETTMDDANELPSSCGDRATKSHQDSPTVSSTKLSVVSRLFGGTLVRHTSCTECSHTSSVLDEPFSCLYVPITPSDSTGTCPANEQSTTGTQNANTDVDLTTLLRTHFSQIERVSSTQACESCGKRTVLARRLCLKSLAPHVLICLKVFTFCRESQTPSKIMKKITIPERLCVTLSSPDTVSLPETQSPEPFTNDVLFPHSESSSDPPTDSHGFISDHPDSCPSASTTTTSSSSSLNDGSRSVTTRTFKLQATNELSVEAFPRLFCSSENGNWALASQMTNMFNIHYHLPLSHLEQKA